MKRSLLILISLSALALSACEGTQDSLTNGGTGGGRGPQRDPNATAGGEDTTYDHSNDPAGVPPGPEFGAIALSRSSRDQPMVNGRL